MSVLLEALKKAAEDKKRALDNASREDAPLSESDAAKSELKLSSTDGGVQLSSDQESVSGTTSFSQSEEAVAQDSSFKLVLDEPTDEHVPVEVEKVAETSDKSETSDKNQRSANKMSASKESDMRLVLDEPKDINEEVNVPSTDGQPNKADSIGADLTELNKKSDLKLILDDVPEVNNNVSHDSQEIQESSDVPKIDSPSSVDDDSLDKNSHESSVNELSSNAEVTDLHSNVSTDSSNLDNQVVDSVKESGVVKEKFATKDTAISASSSQADDLISSQPSKASVHHNTHQNNSDSFEWSMDSLPGYSEDKHLKNDHPELNPILVAGALSQNPSTVTTKKRSRFFILLIVIFIFISIVFYGLMYYKEQDHQLEQQMRKYNLAKTRVVIPEKVQESNAVVKPGETQIESTDELNEALAAKELSTSDGDNAIKTQTGLDELAEQDDALLNNDDQSKAVNDINQDASPVVNRTVTNMANKGAVKSSPKSDATASNTSKPVKAPTKPVVVVHSESEVLSQAYLAYEQAEYIRAIKLFEDVLKINPKNEFALIGLGNITAVEQQYALAMNYYQKALMIQPESIHAFEAIASISGHLELNDDWKNSLMNMVLNYPASAVLHNALGNIYSQEKNWLAAQDAYFQAYSLEVDNADYQVNLAISLDQLGQHALAAQHYTQALALVGRSPINFNEEQIKQRLISLRQFLAGNNE